MDVVKKNCIGFALFHAAALAAFKIYMNTKFDDGQLGLNWLIWLIIDFPISLLTVFCAMVGAIDDHILFFIHGILGTIWWYFLPKFMLAVDPRSK